MRDFLMFLMPFWYPVMTKDQMLSGPIHSVQVWDTPYVLYTKNTSIICHSDICPHMGGSFAKGGWLSGNGNICCPYHGFEFDQGHYMGISIRDDKVRTKKAMSRPMLPSSPVLDVNEYIYVFPMSGIEPLRRPYFPPEHTDADFVRISGARILDCPVENLVENLLDMIHISFVHSFGNKELPLPTNIQYSDLDEYSGRTVFEYQPNEMTIARQMGDQDRVRVENEFYLPTTTLTRVSTGNITKTVFTQSLPLSDNRTVLFWTVYRNFWKDPYIPHFTMIGDMILRFLMERTIDEDQSILSRAYSHAREGFLTKYDITIRKYRKKRNLFRP